MTTESINGPANQSLKIFKVKMYGSYTLTKPPDVNCCLKEYVITQPERVGCIDILYGYNVQANSLRAIRHIFQQKTNST